MHSDTTETSNKISDIDAMQGSQKMFSNFKHLYSRFDDILVPLGFVKDRMVWNRHAGEFLDVIDIQKDSRSDEFTINAGVYHESLRKMLGFSAISGFVNEFDCAVRSRCGALIDGKDHWWKVVEASDHRESLEVLQTIVIPFVESMHDETAMEDFLLAKYKKMKRFPFPECLYVFGLQTRRGEASAALEFLREVERKALGDWKLDAQRLIRQYEL